MEFLSSEVVSIPDFFNLTNNTTQIINSRSYSLLTTTTYNGTQIIYSRTYLLKCIYLC